MNPTPSTTLSVTVADGKYTVEQDASVERQAATIADLEARLQLSEQRIAQQAGELARLRAGVVVQREPLMVLYRGQTLQGRKPVPATCTTQ